MTNGEKKYNDINSDYYCSGFCFGGTEWCNNKNKLCISITGEGHCPCYRRKFPTPEQYREEYGEDYPEGAAVYVLFKTSEKIDWLVDTYRSALYVNENGGGEKRAIVCACSPYGKPDIKWKPEQKQEAIA